MTPAWRAGIAMPSTHVHGHLAEELADTRPARTSTTPADEVAVAERRITAVIVLGD
jgi:hypothetical protein